MITGICDRCGIQILSNNYYSLDANKHSNDINRCQFHMSAYHLCEHCFDKFRKEFVKEHFEAVKLDRNEETFKQEVSQ